ncbi:zf-HC2 domain-containing protein [Paracoccus cavernae]|uniref:Zf-HC2 domain-containing protein n=1 Tax=Paracoccus cavernae TaxID=1571207 RepID=A0ABT8DCM3_9RHOB|nr:zf-HC2 domain-containing protein [Paracoccus cavernae]
MSISDETLMAYADGELDQAEAAAVEAALAADPGLQARLRPFSETRRLLGGMAGMISRHRRPATRR